MAENKTALYNRRLLTFCFQIFRTEKLIIQKFCQRHVKASCEQDDGT